MEPMKLKIRLDKGAFTPIREHEEDAGLDLRAMKGGRITPHGSMVFHTGVHVELPPGTCGMLMSKSGLNTRYGITSTGLIDEGFSGEILVKLYNHSAESYMVMAGDKITQLVVVPILRPEYEIVDSIKAGSRGDNGYGSTGR